MLTFEKSTSLSITCKLFCLIFCKRGIVIVLFWPESECSLILGGDALSSTDGFYIALHVCNDQQVYII